MEIVSDEKMLELLEYYAEMTEKQAEVMNHMSMIIKKQALELANLRTIMGAEVMDR